MINEKIWEYNKKIHYLFIDFQEAYDSIHRESLWKIMREFQIPLKLINMCKLCIQDTYSKVRIKGKTSAAFKNKTGLKQGDALSPLLFNIALQKIINKLKLTPAGINIKEERINIMAYADDIILIGESELEIRELIIELEENAREIGLKINQDKTKYVILRKAKITGDKKREIKINKYTFEKVDNFKYLGVITNENKKEFEIQERLKKANKTYFMLQNILKSKNIKIRIKNSVINKILNYGSEA